VLKAKKIKISKNKFNPKNRVSEPNQMGAFSACHLVLMGTNKFNPKNVCCALTTIPLCKTVFSKTLTRTNEMTSAKSTHLIWLTDSVLII